jgi:hypothetical protein
LTEDLIPLALRIYRENTQYQQFFRPVARVRVMLEQALGHPLQRLPRPVIQAEPIVDVAAPVAVAQEAPAAEQTAARPRFFRLRNAMTFDFATLHLGAATFLFAWLHAGGRGSL